MMYKFHMVLYAAYFFQTCQVQFGHSGTVTVAKWPVYMLNPSWSYLSVLHVACYSSTVIGIMRYIYIYIYQLISVPFYVLSYSTK